MDDLLSAIISYLAQKTLLPVSSEIPATRPATFITVGPSGGTFDRFTQRPVYSISAYAASDYAASSLLHDVLEYLLYANETVQLICQVTIQSTYRDDLEDQHGWSASVSVLANRA